MEISDQITFNETHETGFVLSFSISISTYPRPFEASLINIRLVSVMPEPYVENFTMAEYRLMANVRLEGCRCQKRNFVFLISISK